MRKAAHISPCGQYRYSLERSWGQGSPLPFIMLNPSTADANEDDPTIRRCIGFAMREGAAGIYVVNVFALRSTDPSALNGHADPIGPENTQAVGEALLWAAIGKRPVIAAWGAHDMATRQALNLPRRATDLNVRLMCLGVTKAGHPRHPLYVKGDQPFVPWPHPTDPGSREEGGER